MLKKNKHFKRIKGYFKTLKNKVVEIYNPYMLWMAAPFILMEVFIFIFGLKVRYVNYNFISPLIFTISWITLFVGTSLCFKKWIGKIIYIVFDLLFLLMFLTNNIYFSMTKTFFDFRLTESASEGAPYILDAIKNCNSLVYFAFIILIIMSIIGLKKMPKIAKNNYKAFGKVFLAFIIIHTIALLTLGRANTSLTWSSWRNPKNIYNSFNDANKSMKITGFYEYSFRNFYVTFLKSNSSINEEDMEFLNSAYKEKLNSKNKYTSMLKGKNLILIQLEGTDNWLFNKDDLQLCIN